MERFMPRLPSSGTADARIRIPSDPGTFAKVERRGKASGCSCVSIRRLVPGRGQFGIKGQIVTVPIDVQPTFQSLPRHTDDDKRRRLVKPTYLAGLVKKNNIKAWLNVFLENPLYNFYNIKLGPQRVDKIPDKVVHIIINEDDNEKLTDVDDFNDPNHCFVAMNTPCQTIVCDDMQMSGLQYQTHFVAIAPGDGQMSISLLYVNNAA
ncbi:hypothetical protein HPB49_014711 [Dermacentor silvarum]|uniref:Uncharacterized protein n=1 Tax=Dermacentor silvarum TaxID=543639 RepID=A0ACB8CFT1_DERSI|nr:hypothetical protein HPB49_014711 [Dermacentor silvarum]